MSRDSRVETISRLTQWRVESFSCGDSKRSDRFKVGLWNWHLSVGTNTRYVSVGTIANNHQLRYVMYVRLSVDDCKQPPPIARFLLRISAVVATNRHPHTSPVQEISFQANKDFDWEIGATFSGTFVVDVEFLDLKTIPQDGGEATSIWPSEETLQILAAERTPTCLSRMFYEGIHADVTINTADGTLRAHKAVLAASSPVFEGMFLHNMKEKESSTVEINDMSLESCSALLSSMYGTIKEEEFSTHRSALLGAANKYDIIELKNSCEKSLTMDINSENILERLQMASLYNLSTLKNECFKYLFRFWKIFDVRDEIKDFCKNADKELMQEIVQEMLTGWKPEGLVR